MFFSIREAFKNLWRNHLMNIPSIGILVFALFILGVVFSLTVNINSFVDGVQEQFDDITVYLKDDVSMAKTSEILESIDGIIGVTKVVYITKDEALINWKNEWGENAYLLDGLKENPLPNSIVVSLKDLDNAESVVTILNTFEGVEDVKFYKHVIDKILGISKLIKTLGFGFILMLLIISASMIANAIKLTVNSRRKEINIMKYVGATNWFIKRPFLIEGTMLGLISSLISSGLIYLLYTYVYDYLTSSYYMVLASHFVPTKAVMSDLFVIFIVLGMGTGALGSMNAIRKHLNV